MRLGDLDALKEEMDRPFWEKWEWEFICKSIENTPTVEPCYKTTSCLDCKNYDKENYYCPRFCEVIRQIAEENQRPQGEWIALDDNLCSLQRFKCSKCGHQIFCEPSKLNEYKGCYCGAYMRGKEK